TCTKAIRRPRTWRPCARTGRARSTGAASRRYARRWPVPKPSPRLLFDDDVRVEDVAVGFHGVFVLARVFGGYLGFLVRARLRPDFQRPRRRNDAAPAIGRPPLLHRAGVAVEPERERRAVGLGAAPGDGGALLDAARIRGDLRRPHRGVAHLDVLRARGTR